MPSSIDISLLLPTYFAREDLSVPSSDRDGRERNDLFATSLKSGLRVAADDAVILRPVSQADQIATLVVLNRKSPVLAKL